MHFCKAGLLISNLIAVFSFAFLVSCSPVNQTRSLTFEPIYENEKLGCTQSFSQSGKSWRLSQLQFYVSEVSVSNKGEKYEVSLSSNQWQNEGVAMIGGVCGSDFNWQLVFDIPVPMESVDTIEFTIGVPFELNHLNPLIQSSPLNQSDMFWTWQLGHKFFRLDIESEDAGWAFHSGSMGCDAPSPMRPPKRSCRYPNRAKVIVSDINFDKPITLDISNLLSGIELNSDTRCMSSPDTPSCAILLTRLGVERPSIIFEGASKR